MLIHCLAQYQSLLPEEEREGLEIEGLEMEGLEGEIREK